MLNEDIKQNSNLHWMTVSFMALVGIFPRLKPKLWQWLYNKIASFDKAFNFLFMNYGYSNPQIPPLTLDTGDEKFRYAIQLYDHVLDGLEINNKDVLEVGCGRGGGGSYILRYKKPLFYVGIDLSEKAIHRCQQQHRFANAKWLQGSAEAIPVFNESVDIVVNVESSHCYPSMELFLKEVKRTLRSKGYLAFCDLRPLSSIETLDHIIHQSGFKIINKEFITPFVVNALDAFSHTRQHQISSTFRSIFHRAINDFAAIKNTGVYNKLVNGELIYVSYLLQK